MAAKRHKKHKNKISKFIMMWLQVCHNTELSSASLRNWNDGMMESWVLAYGSVRKMEWWV
jgi:hypothetical protein